MLKYLTFTLNFRENFIKFNNLNFDFEIKYSFRITNESDNYKFYIKVTKFSGTRVRTLHSYAYVFFNNSFLYSEIKFILAL